MLFFSIIFNVLIIMHLHLIIPIQYKHHLYFISQVTLLRLNIMIHNVIQQHQLDLLIF